MFNFPGYELSKWESIPLLECVIKLSEKHLWHLVSIKTVKVSEVELN